jgi:hypothetical protein
MVRMIIGVPFERKVRMLVIGRWDDEWHNIEVTDGAIACCRVIEDQFSNEFISCLHRYSNISKKDFLTRDVGMYSSSPDQETRISSTDRLHPIRLYLNRDAIFSTWLSATA